ncbi:MAG: alpha/beta fold hydrolase [Betaproteobacteria bacterium]|nr:alpha/beta fold hydrolase [Betaproteobacteria bacterium]
MIHGLGGTSNFWTPVLPALARFRTVRPDLPGSGRSHRVEGALSMDRFVRALMRVCGAAGVERAHVVAHSMGTIIALQLAALEPRLVRSLALFGPLSAPTDASRGSIRARGAKARSDGEPGMQQIADAIVQAATSSETRTRRPVTVAAVRESLMRQCPEGYARSCEALSEAQSADLSKIACPVLLVTGDEDSVSPPQAVRAIGEKIPGAQIEVLGRCGHWTVYEKPQECSELLGRFYSQRFL